MKLKSSIPFVGVSIVLLVSVWLNRDKLGRNLEKVWYRITPSAVTTISLGESEMLALPQTWVVVSSDTLRDPSGRNGSVNNSLLFHYEKNIYAMSVHPGGLALKRLIQRDLNSDCIYAMIRDTTNQFYEMITVRTTGECAPIDYYYLKKWDLLIYSLDGIVDESFHLVEQIVENN